MPETIMLPPVTALSRHCMPCEDNCIQLQRFVYTLLPSGIRIVHVYKQGVYPLYTHRFTFYATTKTLTWAHLSYNGVRIGVNRPNGSNRH
jgi:hypothetical protein